MILLSQPLSSYLCSTLYFLHLPQTLISLENPSKLPNLQLTHHYTHSKSPKTAFSSLDMSAQSQSWCSHVPQSSQSIGSMGRPKPSFLWLWEEGFATHFIYQKQLRKGVLEVPNVCQWKIIMWLFSDGWMKLQSRQATTWKRGLPW